jgi:hypothetical protein
MKDMLVTNTINLLQAKAVQHKLNIKLLLENQQTIPEHKDITEAILGELKLLAEYEDQLETFKKYYDK